MNMKEPRIFSPDFLPGLLGAFAKIIGPDGRTTGENTDGKGFVKTISEVASISGKKAVIFSAGGAARATAVEMALAGAREVIIVDMSERGKLLADLLNSRTPARASFRPWSQAFSIHFTTAVTCASVFMLLV